MVYQIIYKILIGDSSNSHKSTIRCIDFLAVGNNLNYYMLAVCPWSGSLSMHYIFCPSCCFSIVYGTFKNGVILVGRN